MAGFIDGIGVISGVLGIFSFVQDLFPQPETPSSCQYQFRIGLDGTDNFGSPLTEAGGNIPVGTLRSSLSSDHHTRR